MKGNELHDAYGALDKVLGLGHYRPETVRRAVTATLGYIGARRLQIATYQASDGADVRRLLAALAQVEDAAIRLDGIPQKSDQAPARRSVWKEITVGVRDIKKMLRQEQELAKVAARASRSKRSA